MRYRLSFLAYKYEACISNAMYFWVWKMGTKTLMPAARALSTALILTNVACSMVDITKLSSAFSPMKLAAMDGHYENIEAISSQNWTAVTERDSLKMTPLHWAALGGHDEAVKLLLRLGADPNARDEDDNTALHLSVDPNTTCSIILGGADVNAQNSVGATALHLAAGSGGYSNAKVLLRFGARTNLSDQEKRSALDVAIGAKDLAIKKLLKSCGAKTIKYTLDGELAVTTTPAPQTSTPPTVTTRKPKSTRAPEVRKLTEKEKGLHKAAKDGAEDEIADFCAEGVDPNVADIADHNHTPLHLAAAAGDHLSVMTLLRCGANIDFGDIDGNTALHIAVLKENYKVADILLLNEAAYNISNRAGQSAYDLAQKAKNDNFRKSTNSKVIDWFAEVRALSESEKRLHNSVKEGWYIDVVKLCKAGVDVQVKDESNRGNTAMHLAVSAKNHVEGVIVTLAKCGSKVSPKNADGNTPIHLAILGGSDAAFTSLLLSGADLFVTNNAGRTPYQLGLESGTPFMKRRLASPHYSWYLDGDLVDFFNAVTAQGLKDHKCFFKCIFDGFSLLKDDGTIIEEKLHRGLKDNWYDPKDHKKILPVADTCTKKVKFLPDSCEYLNSWMDCFMKGIEKVKAETKFITYDMRHQ